MHSQGDWIWPFFILQLKKSLLTILSTQKYIFLCQKNSGTEDSIPTKYDRNIISGT